MAEQDTSPDADLQLKKRARRRLVGAVALALLAVIVLPMVMDSEPRPPSQDIQVRIPSQDSPGLTAKVLTGKPAASPMPALEPKVAADTKPAAGTSPPLATAPNPAPPAGTESARAPAAPAAAVPTGSAAKTDTAEHPTTKSAQVSASGADAPAQWVVQLGAYREMGNVKLLLSKLKGVGVPAYTEKFESAQGPRTRVRAGPFASQDAAEKARTRIKIIGVDGPVAPR